MKFHEFVTTFHNRAPKLMFFLGAGSSASANIPTAGDMIWDFKRTIFCAANRIPLKNVSDLSNPFMRKKIQQYFDTNPGHPLEGSSEEYEFYFEKLHTTEGDRRKYIDRMIAAAKPSYGNLGFAALMAESKVRVVWTTNFDRVVEDACSKVFETTNRLTVSALETAAIADEAISEERWPLLLKLHGDIQSRNLKNTSDELKRQDAQLRKSLQSACQSYGLVVCGYSGRDASVMEALEASLESKTSFPSGIFWVHRNGSKVLPRVTAFIERAKSLGIEAHFVEVETFDELVGDLINLLPELPATLSTLLNQHAPRITSAPIPDFTGGYPLVRLNGLPLNEIPTVCRKFVTNLKTHKEIIDAIRKSGTRIVFEKRGSTVIAFAGDEEIKKAFGSFGLADVDLHPIEPTSLVTETAEMGLLYKAFASSLARKLPFDVKKKKGSHFLVLNKTRLNKDQAISLRNVGALFGVVPGTSLEWTQALRLRLEARETKVWFVLEPTFWVFQPGPPDGRTKGQIADFIRGKSTARFNNVMSSVLDTWIGFLFSAYPQGEIQLFDNVEGINAKFSIGKRSAYSLRTGKE